MAETRAQRTLVKSPPELWAEISDLEALARHLGEFGEIRITRLEPETTVAWEGDRARGTVELEPSGWGTRVTLTAEVPDGGEAADPAEATPPPEAEASPPEASEPEPEPERAEPEPAAEAEVRPGFFARWFGRGRRRDNVALAAEQETAASEPAPLADPVVEEPAVAEPPAEEPVADAHTAVVEPEAPAPDLSLDLGRAEAILTEVLDDLGFARHRPFSRLS
jgi:hypothetical protein